MLSQVSQNSRQVRLYICYLRGFAKFKIGQALCYLTQVSLNSRQVRLYMLYLRFPNQNSRQVRLCDILGQAHFRQVRLMLSQTHFRQVRLMLSQVRLICYLGLFISDRLGLCYLLVSQVSLTKFKIGQALCYVMLGLCYLRLGLCYLRFR